MGKQNFKFFSLPKLKEIYKTVAHGLLINHEITAIYYSKYHQFLYTADSLGYVKKWKIEMSDDFQLAAINIYRCHLDEIYHLFDCMNGKFVVTTGYDMCVRVWNSPDFRSVGFFSDESSWNIHDKSTWAKENPFECDPYHFKDDKKSSENITHYLSFLPSLNQTPNDRSHNNIFQSSTLQSEINSFEGPLDSEKYLNFITDFFNNEYIPAERLKTHENKEDSLPMAEITPIKIPNEMHPQDTIDHIKAILAKPKMLINRTKGEESKKSARRSPIPMPILPNSILPKKRRTLPRIAMLTPITKHK